MLIDETANEKYVKYLTINPKEVASEDDQKTDSGTVHTDINRCELKNWKEEV